MDIREAITRILERESLTTEEMVSVVEQIMTGGATDAQIGGFLVALRMKGETVDEITGVAQVMRRLATKVPVSGPHLVDTCGTGGDGSRLFNVSTASAFVVAAAGGRVAKHGNRSVTSSSGSADVLEAAGVNLSITSEQVALCIEKLGIGFMFAVNHHSAMKYAIGPRKELGARTLFNLLGPLTNPASAPHQVMGVFSKEWVLPIAQVLQNLGSVHVLVVHAEDGLDEISLATPTWVAELHNGVITEYQVTPEQFGIKRQPLNALSVANAQDSLELVKQALNGEGAAADIVALNAGAAIYAADLTESLAQGVKKAKAILASGAAAEKLDALAQFTRGM